ncbi:hypothetical protein GEMRC1_003124 [Eukaryota sp. GEM-RC1]
MRFLLFVPRDSTCHNSPGVVSMFMIRIVDFISAMTTSTVASVIFVDDTLCLRQLLFFTESISVFSLASPLSTDMEETDTINNVWGVYFADIEKSCENLHFLSEWWAFIVFEVLQNFVRTSSCRRLLENYACEAF